MTSYTDPSTWRLATGLLGVPYRIVDMSGSMEPERASMVMKVLVPANRLLHFALEMFPAPYYFGSFPVYPARGRVYGTPLQAARFTWKGHIDGKPVDPFGVDPTAPDNTYQPNCEVSIEFTTDRDQDESDPNDPFTFLEVNCSGAGEFIHSTAPKAKWTDNMITGPSAAQANKLQTTPISIVVPEVEWDITWPRIPHQFYKDTLVTTLRNSLGKVNSAIMTVLFSAPVETVLFVGYSLRQSYTWRTGTQPPFTMNLKFLEKHVIDDNDNIRGHNDFWKADVGWQRLLYDGTNPTYASADLNALFTPATA